jgi:putative transposase
MKDYKKPEDLIGENELLKQLAKRLLERSMRAEMTEHLACSFHQKERQHPQQQLQKDS